jgi:aspartyl-tRNA(Asn)/glutamyl-tRNA(Gln) amidotransferase subunit C
MAKLSREDVLRLADLARIHVTDAEVDEFSDELSPILEYVEQLNDIDVDGLSPTNQVTGLTNVTRPDTVIDYGYSPHDLLKNVPKTEANQLKVPRMIG